MRLCFRKCMGDKSATLYWDMQSRSPVHDDQKYHIVGESSENNLHFPLSRKGGIDHVYFFVNGARTQDIPLDTNHNHSLKGGMRPILPQICWSVGVPTTMSTASILNEKRVMVLTSSYLRKTTTTKTSQALSYTRFLQDLTCNLKSKAIQNQLIGTKIIDVAACGSSQEICTWWRSSWPKQSSGNLFVFIISLQTKMEWTQFQI